MMGMLINNDGGGDDDGVDSDDSEGNYVFGCTICSKTVPQTKERDRPACCSKTVPQTKERDRPATCPTLELHGTLRYAALF